MMNFGGGSKKATAQVEKWVRKQLQVRAVCLCLVS